MIWNFIGWMAVICISIQFVPQTIRVIYSKKTKDVSILTYLLVFTGSLLWALYGFNKKDYVILTANIMVFISSLTIIATLIIKNKK